jgi:fatty-acyl-CoA synthase
MQAVALGPGAFLGRTARVFPNATAVVDGDRRWTYAEYHDRARRLAGLVAALGVEPGDRVAVLAPNRVQALDAVHGLPLADAVVVPLNVRLSVAELSYIVDHAEPKVLLCDEALADVADQLVVGRHMHVLAGGAASSAYERALEAAEAGERPGTDETRLLSLNYTSGTTGKPKGVMYHHRGAYLQALAMALQAGLTPESVFLWTLPIFHCNGWCFPWAVTAVGARHVCLDRVDPAEVWRLIRTEGVTHLNAAPTVLISLLNHPGAAAPHRVRVATGGAPPSPTLLARADEVGFDIVHLYGLTETFGPALVCEPHPEWRDLDVEGRAKKLSRQGVPTVLAADVAVLDKTGCEVPHDGSTLGEIAVRGSAVMTGYYRDDAATATAMRGGWFHTGDLAVVDEAGYIELRDRLKDIIISGGENIASVEVEQAIASHPAVLEAAVVGVPDEQWGEVPVAVVVLKDGHHASADEIRDHVRARLAHFKAPRRVVFGDLPKTATGKIQKFRLRQFVMAESP